MTFATIGKIGNSVTTIMARIIKKPKEVLQQQITPTSSAIKSEIKLTNSSTEEKNMIASIRKTFPDKAIFSTPTGIKKMIALIDKQGDTITLHDLGKIWRDRLGEQSTWDPETTKIYTLIQALARNPQSKDGQRLLAKNEPLFINKRKVPETKQETILKEKTGLRMVK